MNLNRMTKAQLLEIATELGIFYAADAPKAVIIGYIERAQAIAVDDESNPEAEEQMIGNDLIAEEETTDWLLQGTEQFTLETDPTRKQAATPVEHDPAHRTGPATLEDAKREFAQIFMKTVEGSRKHFTFTDRLGGDWIIKQDAESKRWVITFFAGQLDENDEEISEQWSAAKRGDAYMDIAYSIANRAMNSL